MAPNHLLKTKQHNSHFRRSDITPINNLHQLNHNNAHQQIIMADQVKNAAGSASNSWDKMSEDQKKQTFDSLPQEKKQGKSYLEWVKEGYHNQYENWMPWIEDQYLKWFTNDNKTSYAAKGKSDHNHNERLV